MPPWLFHVYIYGWCGMRDECKGACERAGTAECQWWRFEINQLLFTDDAALVADSEEKLCCLVSELVVHANEKS